MKGVIDIHGNTCRFLAKSTTGDDINILNFVYESKPQQDSYRRYETIYKMHLVIQGTAALQVLGNTYRLEQGDVFFTFPAMSYAIQSEEDFEYMYISYVGPRANKLMEELAVTKKNFLFRGRNELIPLWENAIQDERPTLALKCEGILLYSFSVLGEQRLVSRKTDADTVLLIKKYVDDHFDDPALSLQTISTAFSYNPKYVSTLFKEKFHIGLLQYITTLRIQKACTLMEQGFTSVKDVSFQCGFSDPLYFSKVFKKKMGVSPREHLASLASAT